MRIGKTFRRILSLLLALLLWTAPVMQVSAEEIPEEAGTILEQNEPETPEDLEEPEIPEEPENPEEPEEPENPEEPEEPENPEEPEEPEGPETPEEPEEPEEPEIPSLWGLRSVATIGEVLEMSVSADPVMTEGTVVFSAGTQAILQDETGGIRLSFDTAPEITPGDILLVTGRRSGGLAVESYEKTGTGPLPAVESSLDEDRSDLRILVRGAVLGWDSLSQKGSAYRLEGTVPDGLKSGDRVDAWGVMIDAVFYADTILPSETEAPESGMDGDWNLYFGQLHAHTDISDGLGTVEEAFAYAYEAEGLDFFAVTDHSNSFDNAEQGAVHQDGTAVSAEWAAGKAAAEAVTDGTFVGIFGYEMTWPEDMAIGHISTFGTPGWQTRDQAGMHTLEGYLDTLAAVPDSVSQFNHPGLVFGDFHNFSGYTPQHDARVQLLEVGGEGGFTAYNYYTKALDKGWHLAPSNNQNNHNGSWGDETSARTVVLARELTEAAIYDAVRNYRVYATADEDLKILYHLNGAVMGSIIGEAETLTAEIALEDLTDEAVGLVEVITDQAEVAASVEVEENFAELSLEVTAGGSYYYLRVTQPDGQIAVTAPVWVDAYDDVGIADFTADTLQPDQGTEATLTLTVYNHESVPFLLESVEFSVGEAVLQALTAPGQVEPVGILSIPVSHTSEEAGAVTITATVTGRIAGIARTYQKNLTLHYQPLRSELLPISDVREGQLGEACRIRGYVTAGTSNPANTFPGSVYLQDETGGIQIVDFSEEGIQLGTPMEVEGILRSRGGNLMLAMTDYQVLEENYYRFVPRTMAHENAMDYDVHGGELLQIEGSVMSVTKTADEKGVSRFTIRDIRGDLATVVIEEGIGSGAYGDNELASEVKTKRTVRAMGLLHTDEYGKTVLRVRNCDEVAYVPPRKDPTNPKTGDWLACLRFWK